MNEHAQKVDIAISEIKKILKVISSKDVSTNTTSALQLIESWLMHIQKYVVGMSKAIKSPESTDLARASALQQEPEQNPQKQGQVQEMSSMAASSAAGASGGIDLGSDKVKVEEEDEEVEEDSLYLKEGTLPIRQIIREALKKMYNSDNKSDLTQLFEELGMGEPPQVGEQAPTAQKMDTGTGLAENVFKQIAGNIEDQYNLLKTSEAQRQSFTKHLERALQVGMSQLQVEFAANRNNISGDNGRVETKTGDKSKQDQFARDVQIPGLDETGKGFAFKTYKDIFPKISTALNGDESVTGLNDPSDRESFIKVIINKVQQLCNSLEEHMKPQEPAGNIEQQLQSAPGKTNANSNFLMP